MKFSSHVNTFNSDWYSQTTLLLSVKILKYSMSEPSLAEQLNVPETMVSPSSPEIFEMASNVRVGAGVGSTVSKRF